MLGSVFALYGGASVFGASKTLATDTDLGELRVFRPDDAPKELVFLFSDLAGWDDRMDRAAAGMVDAGAAVLGVDLPAYVKALAANNDTGCHYLDSAIEGVAKGAEQAFGIEDYRWPIVAGIGAGGTIAHGAAAQPPPATIAGAVVVDPVPVLKTRLPLCAGAPATPAAGGGYAHGPFPKMPGWLTVADTKPPPAMPWVGQINGGGRVAAPFDADPATLLVSLLKPKIGYAMPTASGLGDLPLIEMPAAHQPEALAIVLSGDGGWRGIDMQVGQALSKMNISVVGIDTLRYFCSPKTPDKIAADLDTIVRHYQAAWGLKRVLLIGYSFGADVLPAAVNRMDESVLDDVDQISLLGLAKDVAFEFHLGQWLGLDNDDAAPIAPEVQKLDLAKVQCIYGEDEDDTLCRDPLFHEAEVIETKGGHHFDGDYAALARRIIAGFERRST